MGFVGCHYDRAYKGCGTPIWLVLWMRDKAYMWTEPYSVLYFVVNSLMKMLQPKFICDSKHYKWFCLTLSKLLDACKSTAKFHLLEWYIWKMNIFLYLLTLASPLSVEVGHLSIRHLCHLLWTCHVCLRWEYQFYILGELKSPL